MKNYTLVECPRDAMQGIREFIPTPAKIEYLNALLRVGFDILDCGSFVSPKAIPQMQDTKEVIPKLQVKEDGTKLLCIVANLRGAEEAAGYENITYLGFPFSVSEEFQLRNTNSTREESLKRVEEILNVCNNHKKELILYLSMAFGNPYGEQWSPEMVVEWAEKLRNLRVKNFGLADTIGCSDEQNIRSLFTLLNREMKNCILGVHLHSRPEQSRNKIQAAWESGCRVYDSALLGYGGCPMAKDELTGNVPTEVILQFIREQNIPVEWNETELNVCIKLAGNIFSSYH